MIPFKFQIEEQILEAVKLRAKAQDLSSAQYIRRAIKQSLLQSGEQQLDLLEKQSKRTK